MDRTPQHLRCGSCKHVWIGLYLPMDLGLMAQLLKSAMCPACGGTEIFMTQASRALPNGPSHPTWPDWPGLSAWIAGGEFGASSEFIVSALTGALRTFEASPRDPADLRRCRLLLEAVPALQADFDRMRLCSRTWAGLVDAWPELCALMDEECPDWRSPLSEGRCEQTYARMRDLQSVAWAR